MTMQLIIKGAGDLATGAALRLWRSGYRFAMLELERPTAIRRTVAFSQAVYDGRTEVAGLVAQRCAPNEAETLLAQGVVPVVAADETRDATWLENFKIQAFVDATLAKRPVGLNPFPDVLTIALGPGFTVGQDAHAVIETARGHYLGSVILEGAAEADTGVPGVIGGYGLERLIKSPGAGEVRFSAKIGESVSAGDILGRVGERPIVAAISGVLRGALQNGLTVREHFKIGDIDPRPEAAAFIHSPSDKALAVAGGVLEALLRFGVLPAARNGREAG